MPEVRPRVEVTISRSFRRHDAYELYVDEHLPGDQHRTMKPIKFEWGEPKGMYTADEQGPTCIIPAHVLRDMLRQLDERGIRPEDHDRMDGELQATKLHLADARNVRDKALEMVRRAVVPERLELLAKDDDCKGMDLELK